MHAWGLRLRRALRTLALAHPPVLPSAMRNDVGTLVAIISQLNTRPTCAPVNASPPALRLQTHDSGSGWFATPFLCDSFIHNSTPVYPGALRILLGAISTAIRKSQPAIAGPKMKKSAEKLRDQLKSANRTVGELSDHVGIRTVPVNN